MNHAMQGHPRGTGHGGEFRQNVVHGEGNSKPLQYSCLENSRNSMKRNGWMEMDKYSNTLGQLLSAVNVFSQFLT